MRRLRFAWDSEKAASNLLKHGISFEDGTSLFSDPDEVMLSDPDHSEEEERFVSIGRGINGKLMLACYTEADDTIRLINVRMATMKEARAYQLRGEYNA